MAARQPSIHYMRVTGLALLLGAEVNSSVHSFNKHLPGPDSLQPCPRHWGGPKSKETLSLFSRGSRCRRGEASSAVSCLLELLLQRGEASVGVCTGCLTSQRCLFGGRGGRCFQAEEPSSRSARFCQLITRIQSVLSMCSALVQGCVGSGFHAPHVDWEGSKQTACIKLLSALRPHPGEIPNVLPDSVSIWHTTISIHCSCSCTCGLAGMWLMLAEPP